MRLIIITSLIALAIIVAFNFIEQKYYKYDYLNKVDSEDSTQVESFEKINYLIPVTIFTSKLNSISTDELTNATLLTLKTNEDLLPSVLLSKVQLVDNIQLKPDTIFLLTPEQVKPWYKTLYLDKEFFWSSTFNSEKYSLKKITFSSEATQAGTRTTILTTGEIIPARAVDRLGLNKYNNYTYLFDFFRSDIENADLAITMLENSVLGNPTPCTGCMSFTGDDQVIEGLSETGFDFLSTAGNHEGDAGQTAYANTLNLLEKSNIEFTGSGNCINNCKEGDYDISKPAVKEINGVKFGMLAADDIAAYYWKQNDSSKYFGTNSFSKLENGLKIDEVKVAKVKTIREKYNIDYLIIYLSWGIEYTNFATAHQKELGHKLIDAGADLIVASHPHWVQNIEFYKEKPIIYSLGNFIFDQTHTLESRQGVVVNFHYLENKAYGLELKNIEIMPHQICGYHQTKNDITPKLLTKEITLKDVKEMDEISGCVYWQPKKLEPNDKEYQQIIDRIYEFTII